MAGEHDIWTFLAALALVAGAGWVIGHLMRSGSSSAAGPDPVSRPAAESAIVNVCEMVGDPGRALTRRLVRRLSRIATSRVLGHRLTIRRTYREIAEPAVVAGSPRGHGPINREVWVCGRVLADGMLELDVRGCDASGGVEQVWRCGLTTICGPNLDAGACDEATIAALLAAHLWPGAEEARDSDPAADSERRELIAGLERAQNLARDAADGSGRTDDAANSYLLAWHRMQLGLANAMSGGDPQVLEQSVADLRALSGTHDGDRQSLAAFVEANIAAACSALSGTSGGYARLLEAIESCEKTLSRPTARTEPDLIAAVRVLRARLLIRIAEWDGEPDLLDGAAGDLAAAGRYWPIADHPGAAGEIALSLGELERVRADLSFASRHLELAIGHFRDALACFTVAGHDVLRLRTRRALADALTTSCASREDTFRLAEAEEICRAALSDDEGALPLHEHVFDRAALLAPLQLALARILTLRVRFGGASDVAREAVALARRGIENDGGGMLRRFGDPAPGNGFEILADAVLAASGGAIASDAFCEAAALYGRALDITGPAATPARQLSLARKGAEALLEAAGRGAGTRIAQEASKAFAQAEALCTHNTPPTTRAGILIGRARALALGARGANGAGSGELSRAIATCRRALRGIERRTTPRLWAGLQCELGKTLAALGLVEGRAEPLDEAMEAFRRALGAYTGLPAPDERLRTLVLLAEAAANAAELGGSREKLAEARKASLAAFDDLAGSNPAATTIEPARQALEKLEAVWRRQQI